MSSVKLNFEEYRDKVYACWVGKNIGGTMGTPYEGTHDVLDVKGFVTKEGEVLPNDDLDIQLVWLYAVQKHGPLAITPALLGEVWLSHIIARWNEYGIGFANMQNGFIPPLSADYNNSWKHSNGAWIRTEIWACLAPGCPEIAAKYSIADATIDHGTGEGTQAAVFVAAMQSAAFVVKDIRKCIDIGLSYIPYECRMADSIREVIRCYDEGMSPIDARNYIQQRNSDIGNGWFEAPSNVAYAIIGLLWGEGDFKKTMITAINCGDDTDCTAATVGATLGILYGMEGIPQDWKQYIGDDLVTISFNRSCLLRHLPGTCTELTEQVVKEAPFLLHANRAPVSFVDGATEIPENIGDEYFEKSKKFSDFPMTNSMSFSNAFLSAVVALDGDPEIKPLGERKIYLRVKNDTFRFDNHQYNLELRWWLPEGFTVEGRKSLIVQTPTGKGHSDGTAETEFVIRAGENVQVRNKCVLEVSALGRPSALYIPIVLLG